MVWKINRPMTGLPLAVFSKYWFPLRSVPTKRARDPTILSRDFNQDIAVIAVDLGSRLVVFRNETRFFWRKKAG